MSALSRLRFSKSLFAAALCIVVLCSVGLPNAHAQLRNLSTKVRHLF